MDNNEIILEVEHEQIKCEKSILMQNSDYFKVMFESDFMERHQSIINLQGVSFKSLSTVITLLCNKDHFVEEEDLLSVLETVCMLQFDKIRPMCIDRVTKIIHVRNCLEIWNVAELLDLQVLHRKAKNLLLTEFDQIRDTHILNFNLVQLHDYLANVCLWVNNEIDIFTTCMKWYDNSYHKLPALGLSDETKLCFYFLTFMDFNRLSNQNVQEIRTHPRINSKDEIVRVLTNILNDRYREATLKYKLPFAKELILLNCRRRVKNNFPCMLLDRVISPISYDSDQSLQSALKVINCQFSKDILLFDYKNSNFNKILNDINIQLRGMDNLINSHVLGYKELIFLFGEIRGQLSRVPYERRHYESCVVNGRVWIIGGIGNYTKIQDNMFWYNYKQDEWSQLIQLPCRSLNIKCCEYKNELFLLNIDTKYGYLYNLVTNRWKKLKIRPTDAIEKCLADKFMISSYEDYICIKGTRFIKLKINEDKMEEVSCTVLKENNSNFIEAIVCGDYVYSIYKRDEMLINGIVFESYNILNNTSSVIIESDFEESGIKLCDKIYTFNENTKLFNLSHYTMVDKNLYINDFSL
ncbi:BTB And C-terminal Kelch [Popillia japonica]|uniref:BTB And C-terminal Kelch n=1 Tax=Popillia japonica TaxID=7064 RepID=A0AAW1IAA8_POPJA